MLSIILSKKRLLVKLYAIWDNLWHQKAFWFSQINLCNHHILSKKFPDMLCAVVYTGILLFLRRKDWFLRGQYQYSGAWTPRVVTMSNRYPLLSPMLSGV